MPRAAPADGLRRVGFEREGKESREPMSGRARDLVEKGLAVLGIVVILVPVIAMAASRLQVATVLVGILMMQAGVWRLAAELFPGERVYCYLREEVDEFLEDIRDLNTLAVEGDAEGVEEVRQRLHARVEPMVEAAGEEC